MKDCPFIATKECEIPPCNGCVFRENCPLNSQKVGDEG